jgi:hypothetical protein
MRLKKQRCCGNQKSNEKVFVPNTESKPASIFALQKNKSVAPSDVGKKKKARFDRQTARIDILRQCDERDKGREYSRP